MKKILIIIVALTGCFGFISNAQIAIVEKYGLKVEMYLADIGESKNRKTGNVFPYIAFNFVVSGENCQFSKIVVRIKLLYNIYNFSTLTTTSDLNGVHEELVRKFNKHSPSNSFEIKNQYLVEEYILSKEYWKLPCTSTRINEEQLRECFTIEIKGLY
jgi:hypothetical protein